MENRTGLRRDQWSWRLLQCPLTRGSLGAVWCLEIEHLVVPEECPSLTIPIPLPFSSSASLGCLPPFYICLPPPTLLFSSCSPSALCGGATARVCVISTCQGKTGHSSVRATTLWWCPPSSVSGLRSCSVVALLLLTPIQSRSIARLFGLFQAPQKNSSFPRSCSFRIQHYRSPRRNRAGLAVQASSYSCLL